MFNIGDRVRCKRGYLGDGQTDQRNVNPLYGGSAYEEGKVLTVRRIKRYPECRDVVFFEECGNGVFIDALESVDKEGRYLTPFKFIV